MCILIVEDEKNISLALKDGFEQEGFEAVVSETGEDAFYRLSKNKYELIVLDWMLPGRSGIEILELLRSKKDWTPVIITTAKDHIDDKVMGLESRADDYLVKPFAFAELLARVKSHLRRDKRNRNSNFFDFENLKIDVTSRSVTRSKNQVDLTNKEFDLPLYLSQNNGSVVTREMLAKDVWKINSRITSMDSVIDVHINRLRKKIDHSHEDKIIETIRGVGFRLNA